VNILVGEKPSLYIKNGKKDYDKLIKVVKESLGEEVSTIVVASHFGNSAIQIAESLGKGSKVVSISEFKYSDDVKKRMKKLKMGSIEKAELPIQDYREKRDSLLKVGVGVKAAMEVSVIAHENQLVVGDFISIAGGGRGFDTALLVSSSESDQISNPIDRVIIKEYLALPK
jgi:hypothetical protein